MEVRKRWKQLWRSQDELSDKVFIELTQCYNDPSRHYHNLQHVLDLLVLSEKFSGYLKDRLIIDLSIFYHDVIYQAGRKDNEEQSAAFARKSLYHLTTNLSVIEKVISYVLATKDHFSVDTEDNDLKYFLDFDLSILSAEPRSYQKYASAIRREYAAIPDEFYKSGRLLFLKKALNLPHLYFTDQFRKTESQAKANLNWEVQLLEQG